MTNACVFSVYDIYLPKHAQGPVTPHTIVTLPNTNGMQLLLCYDNEGVYVNTYGKVTTIRSRIRITKTDLSLTYWIKCWLRYYTSAFPSGILIESFNIVRHYST